MISDLGVRWFRLKPGFIWESQVGDVCKYVDLSQISLSLKQQGTSSSSWWDNAAWWPPGPRPPANCWLKDGRKIHKICRLQDHADGMPIDPNVTSFWDVIYTYCHTYIYILFRHIYIYITIYYLLFTLYCFLILTQSTDECNIKDLSNQWKAPYL